MNEATRAAIQSLTSTNATSKGLTQPELARSLKLQAKKDVSKLNNELLETGMVIFIAQVDWEEVARTIIMLEQPF